MINLCRLALGWPNGKKNLRPNLSSTKVNASRRKSMQVDAVGGQTKRKLNVQNLRRLASPFGQGLRTFPRKAKLVISCPRFSRQRISHFWTNVTINIRETSTTWCQRHRVLSLPSVTMLAPSGTRYTAVTKWDSKLRSLTAWDTLSSQLR